MSLTTITVKHHMSAGHRILGLVGPGSKCANLHGHTFGIEWTFAVDPDELTLEFAAVKGVLRSWIKQDWDHGYIVDPDDDVLRAFLVAQKLKHMVLGGPPTTERMAWELAEGTMARLPHAALVSVTVTEGPHNSATWNA